MGSVVRRSVPESPRLVAIADDAAAALVILPAALSDSMTACTRVVKGVICVAPGGALSSPTKAAPVEISVPPLAQIIAPLKLAGRVKSPVALVIDPVSVSHTPSLPVMSAKSLAPDT